MDLIIIRWIFWSLFTAFNEIHVNLNIFSLYAFLDYIIFKNIENVTLKIGKKS